MQAWALQQVLKRMGHEPVTIDRQPALPSASYKATRLAYRAAMKFMGKRKAPVNFERYLPTLLQHTKRFIDQHLTMSGPLYSTEQLTSHFERNNYDAVIVGSDQTWRPSYSPNIYNYFLDFLAEKNIRRIAYATSFGIDHWEFNEKQTEKCATLAQKFDAISVRETAGIDLCRHYLNVDAGLALDPTLLLDRSDYEELLGASRMNAKPAGIYTYFLDQTPEKAQLAQRVAATLNEKIFACQAKYSINDYTSNNIETYIIPDVNDWLAGFSNANYVVTDSFHGVVLSIIFNKHFLVINNNQRGGSRFTSLLEKVDLMDRLIDPKSINLFDLTSIKKDLEISAEKLYGYKKESISKIKISLNLGV